MARSVARPVAATASPVLNSASIAVANLAAAAAPLVTAAAAGSGVAAAALAAAAGPLAATAAAGSSVAAQALGGIIDPVAATAAAGGSAAGSMLTSITGSIAAAAASAATRVKGTNRGRGSARGALPDGGASDAALMLPSGSSDTNTAMAVQQQPPPPRTPGFCPCEWYVADDERTTTRVFVIQGSDSVASWRANLAFDPVVFEADGLRAKVHRGVYEAACALYDALQPIIDDHIKSGSRGKNNNARLAFTGHSLGGSLATLMMLMLAHRRPELCNQLDPVYTFGAPSVFCDDCCGDCTEQRVADRTRRALGSYLGEAESGASSLPDTDGEHSHACKGVLQMLGLPRNHIRNVMMHLDIVPRAFACDYRLVQAWLHRIGGSFREHSCLQGESNVSLYLPTGITMVLQPNEMAAAQHAMLPPGSGLYLIDDPMEPFWNAISIPWALGGNGGGSGTDDDDWLSGVSDDGGEPAEGQGLMDARAALSALLNSPHPLDILADVAAYGPQGTVSLYHNPFNYVRALRNEAARRSEWRKPAETNVKRAAKWAGGVVGATAHRLSGVLPFWGGAPALTGTKPAARGAEDASVAR